MKKSFRWAQRNSIALLALFFALGGTGYAVTALPRNSVGTRQVIDKSLLVKDFKPSERARLKGPQGLQGETGLTGETGAAGTAVAFARVNLNAGRTLEPNDVGFAPQNKGIVQADVAAGEAGAAVGTTCFNLPSRPASAMVALDNADAAAADRNLVISVSINRGEALGDCPATHNDARVRIVDGSTGAAQDARFFIWFE